MEPTFFLIASPLSSDWLKRTFVCKNKATDSGDWLPNLKSVKIFPVLFLYGVKIESYQKEKQ